MLMVKLVQVENSVAVARALETCILFKPHQHCPSVRSVTTHCLESMDKLFVFLVFRNRLLLNLNPNPRKHLRYEAKCAHGSHTCSLLSYQRHRETLCLSLPLFYISLSVSLSHRKRRKWMIKKRTKSQRWRMRRPRRRTSQKMERPRLMRYTQNNNAIRVILILQRKQTILIY